MKKNGFTLIELIGIITLIAIIGLIALPSIVNVTRQSDERNKKEDLNSIYIATENYVMSNFDEFPNLTTSGNYEYIKVLTLVNEEYIKNDMMNPNTNENFTGKDVVKVTRNEDNTYSYVLTKLNGIYDIAQNLVYSNGVCKIDGTYQYMNGCYIKGTTTNNYVWYSGFLWRIMGINSDGTVRMISEENLTAIPFGTNSAFAGSYVEKWLNEYLISNLKDISVITNYSNWCNATTTTTSTSNTSCTGNLFTNRVGLLSVDEYNLAGGTNSYLKNMQTSWALNSYSGSNLWVINSSGTVGNSTVSTFNGVRAVINVKSDAFINEGDGTIKSPYLLSKTSNNVSGLLYNNVTPGEYITLDGKTYRVVGINSDGSTKIILDTYYKISGVDYINSAYGTNNTFSLDSGIGKLLNNDVLNYLVSENSKIVTNASWYQNNLASGGSYEISLEETNPTRKIEATVGLIRIGEMLSSQSETMLSINHAYANDSVRAKNYWTMTPYTSNTYSYIISNNGTASYAVTTGTQYVRPVINIKSNVKITSGSGTYNNPYKI